MMAHLSACILERFMFLQPSLPLVIFHPSSSRAQNAYSNYSRQTRRERGHLYDCANENRDILEPRSNGGRRAAHLVSRFVVTMLSKVAICSLEMSPCPSKVRRDREKSRLLRNRRGGARTDNTRVIARRLQTLRRR